VCLFICVYLKPHFC